MVSAHFDCITTGTVPWNSSSSVEPSHCENDVQLWERENEERQIFVHKERKKEAQYKKTKKT